MVECDKCSNYELVDTEFFDSMIREIKEKGWKIRRGKYDEWKHICPVCMEESMKHKPCPMPYCGCEDLRIVTLPWGFAVNCKECDYVGPAKPTAAEAWRAWDRG
jgi:hypothetical protein